MPVNVQHFFLDTLKLETICVSKVCSVTHFRNNASELELLEPSISAGMWAEVTVSHIEDPEHIFCQFLHSSTKLSTLMSQIEQYANSTSSENARPPKLGLCVPVIAKYSDGDWYRGSITGAV